MRPLDEPELGAQLRRRGSGTVPIDDMTRAIAQATASASQHHRRPWDRWRAPGEPSQRRAAWPMVSLAVALVLVMAAVGLMRPGLGEPQPTITAPASAIPSAPVSASPASWYVDTAGLEAATQAAANGSGVGRVLVANVAFEAAGDCSGTPDPRACSVVVSGSSPPIRLQDARSDCPPTWYCSLLRYPVVPRGGPFALRLLGDGSVDFIDYVVSPMSRSAGDGPDWSFDALRARLQLAPGAQREDYEAFVVSAWISGSAGIPKCLLVSQPDPRFGCGRAAWLTSGTVQPNAFPTDGWSLTAPTGSIRLPNEAYGAFAPRPTTPGPGVLSETEDGTFLVRAVLPAPTCFLCDGPAAEVVARLDPPESGATAAPSPPAGTPIASLDVEAAYALAYAQKFEQERASGEWHGAWILLGPASQAAFGSEATFGQQEAEYNATGATTYTIAEPNQDPDYLSQSYLGDLWTDIQASQAWFIGVDHPEVVGASAGFEGLVVGPGVDGDWHVWIVH